MLSIILIYATNAMPNTTYTMHVNPEEPPVTYFVSNGVGTQFDYKVAMNYSSKYAFQCRYDNNINSQPVEPNPEYCACSYNQSQPDDRGDYYYWYCNKSIESEKTLTPGQPGILKHGHSCSTLEKSVCVGFVNQNAPFGQYGICMSSENGNVHDEDNVIFAYADKGYLQDVQIESDTCSAQKDIELNNIIMTYEQIVELMQLENPTGVVSMLSMYAESTVLGITPETQIELIGYRFKGDTKHPYTLTLDKGGPAPNITVIGRKGCTNNIYNPEFSMPVEQYCKAKTNISETLTPEYIESVKLWYAFVNLFCFGTEENVEYVLNKHFQISARGTDCPMVIQNLFQSDNANDETNTRIELIQAFSIFIERVIGPTYGKRRKENVQDAYEHTEYPELVVECGLEGDRFCFLSDQYILTGNYSIKISSFGENIRGVHTRIIQVEPEQYEFMGLHNNHLKYCTYYTTYRYFDSNFEWDLRVDDYSPCTDDTCHGDTTSAIHKSGTGCVCVENLNQYLYTVQCTIKQTDVGSNYEIWDPVLNASAFFNDISRTSTGTYSDYITTSSSNTNIVSRKRNTMSFSTIEPDIWDVKIHYPTSVPSMQYLYINTTPNLKYERYGNYIVFDDPVDIRKGAIMYGWNDTDPKTRIEYDYVSPDMMYLKSSVIYDNIGFDYFKTGGVFREGIPMRGKFYNMRDGQSPIDAPQNIMFSVVGASDPDSNGVYHNDSKNTHFSSDDFKHLNSLDAFETSGFVDFRTHPNNMFGLFEELEAYNQGKSSISPVGDRGGHITTILI